MFPSPVPTVGGNSGFPRVSGDVSNRVTFNQCDARFSPRERGCFYAVPQIGTSLAVFPA